MYCVYIVQYITDVGLINHIDDINIVIPRNVENIVFFNALRSVSSTNYKIRPIC